MMKRLILTLLVMLAIAVPAVATQITNAGDPLIGGQLDMSGGAFEEGIAGFAPDTNNWPGAEAPENAVDGTTNKYLNFGKFGTGILITPAGGESILNKIQVWTANDEVPRDPANYMIWGSNDPAVHALNFNGNAVQDSVPLSSFSLVNEGPLNLPDSGPMMSRNPAGLPIEDADFYTSTTFGNIDSYCTYVVVFPELKDGGAANSMQIAELELHGDFTGNTCAVPEPTSAILVVLSSLLLTAFRRR